jgi:UDP-glucose 4-epimerase
VLNVLVTGGAGYIGSHAVRELRESGHGVVVLDDLSHGHREAVPEGVRLVAGDVGEPAALRAALDGVQAVMHFAGRISVGESMADPGGYYQANVVKGLALLEAMRERGLERLIFSSTCAVYGLPVRLPIDESHPKDPVSPYGGSKLAFEGALRDHGRAGGTRAIALRYFNAAGCHPDGTLGEDHQPEEHLIPRAIDAALGHGPALVVHGEDYDTPDGTCIRDYIHVQDLARAHVQALEALDRAQEPFQALNLGTGRGHSVREVVRAVERVTGRAVPLQIGPRRPGDPPQLVAGPGRAAEVLGFRAEHTSLDGVVETAFRWRREHPAGYGTRP